MNKFLVKNPVVSEKSTAMAALGKYVFLVQKKSTLPEVKKAIQAIYPVHVIKTHSISVPAKPKRYGPRQWMTSGYKKVIVTLKKGEKIDMAA